MLVCIDSVQWEYYTVGGLAACHRKMITCGARSGSVHVLVMDSPPQSEYKIILLGDLGAGKTSFFLRVKCKQFIDTATDSVHLACDEFVFNYAVDGTSIKVRET